MDSISAVWLLLVFAALGIGFFAGALLLYWRTRRQFVLALHYLLGRLKLLETEIQQLSEDDLVLKEAIKARAMMDEDDIRDLRRELIDRPRQLEAERAELLENTFDEDIAERLVKDFPETLQ